MPKPSAHGSRTASGSFASPMKSMSIPLNDDRAEKAKRPNAKQMLHSKQLDQLKAAATPQRKRRSMGGEDPSTPLQDEDDMQGVRNTTPMKRVVPVLANFEEWMKMATDNKINAANSWNFALIDYFHDMSLLKEGDGVNFQKASCTLDGCVKIYTSRVDSVATETGKLLSGLADSGNKKSRGGDAEEDGEDGDEDGDGGDGARKRGRKKTQRSEATLVASFEQLKLKKMELEFSVDPLFKKASADFDEGGAKGLLLNHLAIDNTGRIVFDSSDDVQQADGDDSRRDSMDPESDATKHSIPEPVLEDGPVDIAALGARFFPDLDALDSHDICPTLQTFELGGGDNSMELPFLKAPENWRDDHHENGIADSEDQHVGANLGDDMAPIDMDDDTVGQADFDLAPDVGFGEGGEIWARQAALVPQMRPYNAGFEADTNDEVGAEVGVFDSETATFGVTLQHRPDVDHENILNYFDNALQKNWAGPEHWKITRVKEASKPQPQRVRKEKEPFEIDFTAPMSQDLANLLYTTVPNNNAISLPRNQWKSKTQNLLPDDKHFNSKDLLRLFLKPKAKLRSRQGVHSHRQQIAAAPPEGDIDENYWAAQGGVAEDAAGPNYSPDFFQDDGLPMAGGVNEDEDDVFADAREVFSPDFEGAAIATVPAGGDLLVRPGTQDSAAPSDAFGANLIGQSRRSRPDYVQYARVAKKVDVRRLKEEMWRGIGFEQREETSRTPTRPSIPPLAKDETNTLMFTDIMNNLQHVYPKQQMSDISTSYGFICLLHLANEKGLVVENVDGWGDLAVRKDFEALNMDGGD